MHRTGSLLLFSLLAAGCASPSAVPAGTGAAAARVTGTVSYRERFALLAGVMVKVQLADVSRADAPASVIGEQVIRTDRSQPPFRFALPFDPSAIKPQNTYAVSARMEDADGRLQLITAQRYAVITRGAPTHVDLVLRQVIAP